MRVGIDYRPALVNREGIGRYGRELVRALCELGFGPRLGLFGYTLAPRRFSLAELGLERSGAELCRLRFPGRWLPWLLTRLGKGVDDLVGGASVYHHTQPQVLAVREAVEVATIFDCIYVQQAGYLSDEAAERMTEAARTLVARARRVLVPSEFVGAEVVMALGAHPARVAVTPLGCDHVRRHLPAGELPRPREPYILTVSRVDARKNHLRMLRAFERLVADGLPHRWVVAGPDGYGAEAFDAAVAESPARARVERKRRVREAELPLLYRGADLLLFVSLSEGYGLPPVEAMACDTPVVTSCVTSLPEVCGDAALYVEPTDTEAIFDAARGVLRDADLAQELVLAGRRRARELTWRRCAELTLAAYRAAVEPEPEQPRLRRSL